MQNKFSILNNKTILITGGAGAIGSNLVKFLSNYDCEIIILDDLSSGYRENIPTKKNIVFIKDSILNEKILKKIFKRKIDFIFHLAAHFANQNSIDHPKQDLLTNTLGTLNLLEYANLGSVKRFIYSSTSCVYGHDDRKLREDFATKLETPYAISKLTGEEYTHFFYRYYNMKTTVVRYFNSYGPYDPPGKYRNAIPNFFLRAKNKKPLIITGTGQETRNFTYVEDVVQGTVLTLTTKVSIGETYNIGSNNETKILHLAKLINKITNNKAGIKFTSRRKWDAIKRRMTDISKSHRDLDYEPSTTLEEGLLKTWEWFRERY